PLRAPRRPPPPPGGDPAFGAGAYPQRPQPGRAGPGRAGRRRGTAGAEGGRLAADRGQPRPGTLRGVWVAAERFRGCAEHDGPWVQVHACHRRPMAPMTETRIPYGAWSSRAWTPGD